MFPTTGINGWSESASANEPPPVYTLPVSDVALYFDPDDTAGVGTVVTSISRRLGGTSCVCRYQDGNLEARFTQPNVYGVTLLDYLTLEDCILTPFPYRFNWPMQETFSFLTNILIAADGSEQRIAPRDPASSRGRLRAQIPTIGYDETERMLALLFGTHQCTLGIPIWWDAAIVDVDVAQGDSIITVRNTTDRNLVQGRICLLWVAPNEWEMVVLDAGTTLTTVALVAPTSAAWLKGRTVLLPLRPGHTEDVIPITRHARHLGELVEADFALDAEPLT